MSLACSTHPGADARYECKPCRKLLCPACVKELGTAPRATAQCRSCQALATPVTGFVGAQGARQAAKAMARALATPGLAPRLLGTFEYLKDRSLLASLAALAVVASLLHLAPLLVLLPLGCEAAVYFHIVAATADGKDSYDPPDLEDVWDEIFSPAFRYIAAVLPMLGAIFWFGFASGEGPFVAYLRLMRDPSTVAQYPVPLALLVAGVVLWPLLTVIAAVQRSVSAVLNPITWVRMLRVLKFDYVIGAGAFYLVLAVELVILTPIAFLIEAALPVPILRGACGLFVVYLAMALRGRILGELCRPYMED